MGNKVYPLAVIGGGSAGVMAVLRAILNNDECLFFPGAGKNKKGSRGFWVSKVENVPGHAHYKKGIEDPNRETLKWITESEFKDNLHWKKNRGIIDLKKNSDGNFELKDNKDEVYYAKYVILCTGVTDVQPEIKGEIKPIFPYANTQVADYCLRCDGHHTLGKNVTIIGNSSGAAWVGVMLLERYKCPSMTILTHGKEPDFDEEISKLMELYNIKVRTEEIEEILGNANEKDIQLDGFRLKDGPNVDSDFCFISLGMIIYNELAKSVGADLDSRGFVLTNEKGKTSVEGLYVAGDLRANAKLQIYTAWDHAVDSADSINAHLRKDNREALLKG
jgi:thioredoxin reductase (NADPH)